MQNNTESSASLGLQRARSVLDRCDVVRSDVDFARMAYREWRITCDCIAKGRWQSRAVARMRFGGSIPLVGIRMG